MKKLLLLLIFVLSVSVPAAGTVENVVFFRQGRREAGKLLLPHTFDGKSFFAVKNKNTGAQSVAAVMSFSGKVSGELLSRHVSRDGKRGIELGLSGKHFFELDGARPTLVASSGTRKHIRTAVSGRAFIPEKGEKYLLTLSFTPNEELMSYIIRLSDRVCIWQARIKTPEISALTPGAGDGFLAVGGRIIDAGKKQFEYPVSAGTVIHKLITSNRKFSRADIEKLAGGKFDFPPVPGDDTKRYKVGDSWCEAKRYIDKVSGLPVMQLTTKGVYNQGPTVHYGTAFPGGKDEISFASIRNGVCYLMTGNLKTGKLKVHYVGPEIPDHRAYRSAAEIFRGSGIVKKLEGINTASSLHHRKTLFYIPQLSNFDMVDLDTNKVETLIKKSQFPNHFFSTPVFSGDGKLAAVCIKEIGTPRDSLMRYLTVDIKSKEVKTAYQVNYGQTHFFSNPAHPDIWIVKQFKPAFRASSQAERDRIRRTADCYFVDTKTWKTTPLLPRNTQKNITHLEWTGDGKYIVYHGTSYTGGTFVGAMDINGKVVWEYVDPTWNHKRNGLNHVCADSIDHYIVDDGLMVKNQISLIDWKNAGKSGRPLVIPLAHWKNQWIPGQFGHPHPAVSPDGNYVVFYGCKDGNTHIYVIDISSVRKRLKN